MTMTGKQRALAAMAGKPTDRPSVLPSIDVVYAAHCIGRKVGECFADADLHAQALMGALDRHPEIDGLYVNLCLTQRTARRIDANTYEDAGGMGWYVPENDVGTVRTHAVKELEDARVANTTPLQDGVLDTFAAIGKDYQEKYLIVPGISGPYTQLIFMLGLEEVLLMMYDEPEALHAALAQRARLTLGWVQALAQMGAKAVWLGEGAASASILSPAAYAEFVGPYAKSVTQAAARQGMMCFMHVCGDIKPSLAQILATGVPAIDIDYPVPLSRAREAAGQSVCIKGNFNPMELLRGTPDSVLQASRSMLAEAAGPFILGTGCLVARDTPAENLDAMVQAAKTFRGGTTQ